jgi:hypothetical protein
MNRFNHPLEAFAPDVRVSRAKSGAHAGDEVYSLAAPGTKTGVIGESTGKVPAQLHPGQDSDVNSRRRIGLWERPILNTKCQWLFFKAIAGPALMTA